MDALSGFEHIVRENEPLARFTWLRLGGAAEYFAEPTSTDELQQLVRHCYRKEIPVRLLGGGSNLLVRDQGVPGVVIHTGAAALSEIHVDGPVIRAGAGAKLSHVISATVREGLAGLEHLVGIPGSIGGALRSNSGTDNHDIGQRTTASTVITRQGDIIKHGREDLRFAYRSSSLDELVILGAQLTLEPEDRRELTKRMQTLWIVKRSKQPSNEQPVARIFKNAGGLRAADLIDQAGLRGAKVGGAEICDQHANFIIAHPGTTSDDVLRLIDLARSQVEQRLNVELETDIKIW